MGAVDADDVVPLDEPARPPGCSSASAGTRPAHEAAHHHHLVAELLRRRTPAPRSPPPACTSGMIAAGMMRSCESAELLGGEHVVGAADGPAQPRVLHAVEAEPGRRIHHAEVDAELVQPLVHEPRQHGRGPVEHVLARRRPERLLARPGAGAARPPTS